MRDELRKNSSIHYSTQCAEFELLLAYYLSEEIDVKQRLASFKSKQFLRHISDTLGRASCATILFLPHFDVICDLQQARIAKARV